MFWLDNYDVKSIFYSNEATYITCIVSGVLTVIVVCGIYRKFIVKRLKKPLPKDLAIVHGVGRGPHIPSLSPFVLKIETYFRMNDIPYLSAKDIVMSSKGKVPWVEYNGEVIEDSSFIIEFFNKKLSIDMNKDLSLKERGLSRAIQKMMEENLFWCFALCRWVYEETDKAWMGLGWLVPKFIRRTVKQNAIAAGIGRHTQKEVLEIMESDIKAISNILGSQKYIMGNEPTEVDCCVFGFAAQFSEAYHETFFFNLIEEKYPNIKDYCLRMKNRYWADWDDCITHGGTRTPIR